MKLAEIKVIVPVTKPRNPTYQTLAKKANAGGAHRDRKAELKKGVYKHKNMRFESQTEEVEMS
jgi:hypothetical protein